MGKPAIYDVNLLLQAGIDPKTGLPRKLGKPSQVDKELKYNARRIFRIIDEQRACNRYHWTGLPRGISSQELERLLYLRYSLCFFYLKELDQFFFLPYALSGSIDMYGRFNQIKAVPFSSGVEKEEDSNAYKERLTLLSKYTFNVVKDVVVYADEVDESLLTKSAVILRDYTNQMGQTGEARYLLNDHLLEMEADCLPFLRTNLLLASGIQAIRVADADCASEVDAVARQMYNSAMEGNPYVAITAPVEFQELQGSSLAKSSEFFLAMESIDNLLLSTYGIENGGLYEKKAHILESENEVNATNVSLVLQDGLAQRQHFCNIVNSIWNLGIWCEISENLLGYDMNGDMIPYDESTDVKANEEKQDKGGEE